jgi:hypothetical protein
MKTEFKTQSNSNSNHDDVLRGVGLLMNLMNPLKAQQETESKSERKRKRSKVLKDTKDTKDTKDAKDAKVYQCVDCPDDPPYSGASGLWYHRKRHHGDPTRPYNSKNKRLEA